jgi:hypothetical protein
VRDDGGDIVDTGDAIFRDQLQIIMSEDRWQEGAVASFSAWIAGHRGDLVSVDSFDQFVLIDQNPAIIVSWAGQNAAIFRIGYHAVVVGNFAEK